MYEKDILKNGLRVVSHEVKDRESVAIGLWIGVGGRFEEYKVKGISHFLEHIVFKGSQKYSCEEIKGLIEGVGGAFNAFTTEEQTCFYAKIPAKFAEQTFDVLADMVFYPKILNRDVAKEKPVIIEEIKMYRDMPQYYVLELLDGLLWPDHPLGKNLTGSIESVSSMSHQHLLGFHKQHYTPPNIVVSCCGRMQHHDILKLVERKLGKLEPAIRQTYHPVQDLQNAPQIKFQKRDIEQMHVALGMHGFDENHEDRYVMSLLSIILGGNMSSRLFIELREKRGLAYSVSCSAKSLHDTGQFLIRAGVDNQKVTKAVGLILKELEKIKKQGVGQGEFTRAKDYLMGQLMLGLEDTMDHMLWLGEGVIARNKIRTFKSVVRKFEKIKRSDIKRIAKEIFNDRGINLAAVGPLTDKQQQQLKKILI